MERMRSNVFMIATSAVCNLCALLSITHIGPIYSGLALAASWIVVAAIWARGDDEEA